MVTTSAVPLRSSDAIIRFSYCLVGVNRRIRIANVPMFCNNIKMCERIYDANRAPLVQETRPSVSISTPRQPCVKTRNATHAGGRRSKGFHQHGPDQLSPIMSLLQYALRLRDNAIDRIRRVLLGVLQAGPIPHHVAFIMDGNRRYARDKGVKVIQGHVDGFVALRRVRAQNRLCATCTNSIKK
jgi:hypothetical protein